MHEKLTKIQGKTCCFTSFFSKILTLGLFSLYSPHTSEFAMVPVIFYINISAANSIFTKILTKFCRNANEIITLTSDLL